MQNMAQEAFQVTNEGSEVLLEDRTYGGNTEYSVVDRSDSDLLLHAKADICKRGERIFAQLTVRPPTCPDTEGVVRRGIEALFVHFYNSSSKAMKFFLPIVVLSQCERYRDNGIPSISQITTAARQGIAAAKKISDQF